MTKEERILRFKYPNRTDFSVEEILEARRIATGGDSVDRLPTKFIPIGSPVNIMGELYRCVEATGVHAYDPCWGCDIKDYNCTFRVPQCSSFDRRDGKRVWFQRIDRLL